MASNYGESRGLVCQGCLLKYDDFRAGLSWTQVRRDIIAIGFDNRRQKTKYGRRNGTLGFWHELKMMLWDQHVGECEDAYEKALAADAADGGTRVVELRAEAAVLLKQQKNAERAARNLAARKRRRKRAEENRPARGGKKASRARRPVASGGRHDLEVA